MALKKYKPTTPGQRFKVLSAFDEITTDKPEKSLLRHKKSTGGRNSSGEMTVRYRGGGHKRMYRIIDFKRDKDGIPGVVKTIEYDPNRTARIALVFYKDGEKRYIIAPAGLQVGQEILSGKGIQPNVGNTLYLSFARWSGATASSMIAVVQLGFAITPLFQSRSSALTCGTTSGTSGS